MNIRRFLRFLVVILFLLFSMAQTQVGHANEEGACVLWDITGRWMYDSSAGGYGWIEFQQDAGKNITGSYWNEATQGGGTITEGRMNGTSFGFHTSAGEVFQGSVTADGKIVSGTWVYGTEAGSWTAWGVAQCLERQAPPAEGSAFVTIHWGEYVYYADIPPLPSASPFLHPQQQVRVQVINFPGRVRLDIEARFNQEGLPATITVVNVVEGEDQTVVGTLNRVGAAEGVTWYRGTVVIPKGVLVPGQTRENLVSLVDPRDPQDTVPVVDVNQFLQDPAGNIYDANTNQVLPGAMAFLYKKQGTQWVLWPAQEFGQDNPLVSNDEGHYAWLTDYGDFKVKAAKSGYTDGWGGPVTVPPEVTDLHIYLTPTTSPAPKLEKLWVSDSRGLQDTEFVAGQSLEFHAVVSNTTTSDMEVAVTWTTTDPQGQVVSGLSDSKTYAVGPFAVDLKIQETIPPTAPEGYYTLRVELSYGGQTRFKGTQFWVSEAQQVYLPLVLRDHSAPVGGWTTIVSEDFEGAFPGAWVVADNQSGYGEYYWAKRNCRAYAGSYSGWAVGGGANGSALSCGSNYPDEAESWMIYGPFSLADALAAELRFQSWLNSESGYDYLEWMASVDGSQFHGYQTSGSSGWTERIFDLTSVPTLGNLAGQSQVWIAFVFESDHSFNHSEGAYVDNIVLRKCTGSCGTGYTHTAPQMAAGGRSLIQVVQETLEK